MLRTLPVTGQELITMDRHLAGVGGSSITSNSMDNSSRSKEAEEGKVEDVSRLLALRNRKLLLEQAAVLASSGVSPLGSSMSRRSMAGQRDEALEQLLRRPVGSLGVGGSLGLSPLLAQQHLYGNPSGGVTDPLSVALGLQNIRSGLSQLAAGASQEVQAALLERQSRLLQAGLVSEDQLRAQMGLSASLAAEARLQQLVGPRVGSLLGHPAAGAGAGAGVGVGVGAGASSAVLSAAAGAAGPFAETGIGKLKGKALSAFLSPADPLRGSTVVGEGLLEDPVIRAARETVASRGLSKLDGGLSGPSSMSDLAMNKNRDGRQSKTLFIEGDEEYLTDYQCLLRKQLEVFEAGPDDLRGSTQGRNTPILIGQVGLRCRHCANLPLAARTKGAVYYSQTIDGVYQIAQNMSKVHLCQRCYRIPPEVQAKLLDLKKDSRRATGGKEYWGKALRAMGVYEDGKVLRMRKRPSEGSASSPGSDSSAKGGVVGSS